MIPRSITSVYFDYEKSELLSLLNSKNIAPKTCVNDALVSNIKAGFQNDKISGNYRLEMSLTKNTPAKVIHVIHQTIDELKKGIYPSDFLEEAKTELIKKFKSQGD